MRCLGCLVRCVVSSFSILSKVSSLAVLIFVAIVCLSSARAQTAQFTGAVTALGGGFILPYGVAVDGSGNLYVTDANKVKEIPASCIVGGNNSGCVLTLGGGFRIPNGIAVDGSGNVYVADGGTDAVKEIPASCIAGANDSGCVLTLGGGFGYPWGMAVDGSGNVYVADSVNNAVKEIPASCIAGANNSGCVLTLGGGFVEPDGVAVDESGNVYVADAWNKAVKEIPVSCIAGANDSSCVLTLGGGFIEPWGVAVDGSGNVYVADAVGSAVKEIPASCIAGANNSSCVVTLGGGFNQPIGVAVDGNGNIYVGDSSNSAVKEIQTARVNFGSVAVHATTPRTRTFYFTFTNSTPAAIGAPLALTMGACASTNAACANPTSNPLDFAVASGGTCTSGSTFSAGDTCTVNVTFTPQYAGTRNGAVELTNSSGAAIATAPVYGVGYGPQVVFNSPVAPGVLGGGFNGPAGMAVDGSGNVYVADHGAGAVKEIPAGCIAGANNAGCVRTLGGGFSNPIGVAVNGSGNVYVADSGNSAVKEIPASCIAGANNSGCVLTLGGGFNDPWSVAVDGSGNVYVADSGHNLVKEVPASCIAGANNSGCVLTLGGGFHLPIGVAVDGGGNVYVADTFNNAVKEIPASCIAGANNSGCVLTVGGGFDEPEGVALDENGNVYVADTFNNAVKEIPANCIAGANDSSCVFTFGGEFDYPIGVALDGSGNVYVGDSDNSAVKEINRTTPPSLNFASTAVGATSADSPQTVMVQNIGNQPLTFPIPTSSGSYNPSVSANFSYNDSATCLQNGASAATAFTLAPGTSCTVAIDFAPVAPGSISGSAVLTNDSQNASAPNYTTQQISLSGTGIQAITQLGFSTAPPATITAGGNAGMLKVVEQDSSGATVTTGADSVTLAVTGPNGYSQIYTATAASGVASFDLSSVILKTAGSYTYTASSGSYLAATATESVSAASAVSISVVSGSGQSAVIGTAFANTLLVKVEDSYGNPVSGVTVIYTAPSSGASATLSMPTTTADNGETEVTATANGTASTAAYAVLAAVSGVGTPATFYLTNTKASATLMVTPSATVLVYGQPVTISAKISAAGGPAPSGNVTFYDGATALSPSEAVSGSVASYTVSEPSVGSHIYGAQYLGDTNYSASTQTAAFASVVVNKAVTTTLLSASASSVVPGQSVTLTATVSSASAGSIGTPTGTVSFYDGATLLGTGALSGGTATYTTSTLAAGITHSLTASYGGDTNFLASTSVTAVSVPVVARDFSLNISGGQAQTVLPGGSATYNFQLTPTYGSYPGAVSFSVAGLPAGATATFTPSTIAANGGAQTVAMTIQTKKPGTSAKNSSPFERGSRTLLLGFLLFPLLGIRRVRKALRGRGVVMLLLLIAGLAGTASITGCGTRNGFNGQAAQDYTVTVTATSGGTQHSLGVNLNVQ